MNEEIMSLARINTNLQIKLDAANDLVKKNEAQIHYFDSLYGCDGCSTGDCPHESMGDCIKAQGDLILKQQAEIEPLYHERDKLVAELAEMTNRAVIAEGSLDFFKSEVHRRMDIIEPQAELICKSYTRLESKCNQLTVDLATSNQERAVLDGLIHQVYDIAHSSPELNMSNYDDVQVSDLNDAMISVYTVVKTHLDESEAAEAVRTQGGDSNE